MNEYKAQAEKFLADTGTTLEIVKAIPQKRPLWSKDDKHGINYYVTLKNNKGVYSFDFWGSVADAEKIKHGEGHGTKPQAYDILACLSPLYEDNFSDFCSAFGYAEDSITALKTFEALKEQDRNIRKLWDRSEIEKLNEIQ